MDDLSNAVADQTWAAAVLDQLENPKLRTRLKQGIDSFCDEDQDAQCSSSGICVRARSDVQLERFGAFAVSSAQA